MTIYTYIYIYIVDLPTKNCDLPIKKVIFHRYVMLFYQRVMAVPGMAVIAAGALCWLWPSNLDIPGSREAGWKPQQTWGK